MTKHGMSKRRLGTRPLFRGDDDRTFGVRFPLPGFSPDVKKQFHNWSSWLVHQGTALPGGVADPPSHQATARQTISRRKDDSESCFCQHSKPGFAILWEA